MFNLEDPSSFIFKLNKFSYFEYYSIFKLYGKQIIESLDHIGVNLTKIGKL